MPIERPLTPRQHQILRQVARGATNKEIARELGISEQGVKVHISRLLERYGAENRVELVNVTGTWVDADQPGYAPLAADVAGIRAGLERSVSELAPLGELRVAPPRLRRKAIPPAPAELTAAVASLRDLLAEVDVAVKLAKELPADAATGPLVDAIRARVRAAIQESERVAGLIDRERAVTTDLTRATAS